VAPPSGYSLGFVTTFRSFLQDVAVVSVDDPIAHQAAMLGARLRRQGQRLNTVNLVSAATALVRGFTLVTHSQVFAPVPGLSVPDWLVP
jgi:tRNA(fMet)-specific endonuclease VapC